VFWHGGVSNFFRKEEEVLLPVLVRYGGDLEEKPIARMLGARRLPFSRGRLRFRPPLYGGVAAGRHRFY